jgi:hypothetical protein
VLRLVITGNSHLHPRLIHCVQKLLDFLLAHPYSENRVSSKGDAQEHFAKDVSEHHASPDLMIQQRLCLSPTGAATKQVDLRRRCETAFCTRGLIWSGEVEARKQEMMEIRSLYVRRESREAVY